VQAVVAAAGAVVGGLVVVGVRCAVAAAGPAEGAAAGAVVRWWGVAGAVTSPAGLFLALPAGVLGSLAGWSEARLRAR
jgi:hypothetical protein